MEQSTLELLVPGRLASDELVAGDLEKSSCVIKNVNKPEKKADD